MIRLTKFNQFSTIRFKLLVLFLYFVVFHLIPEAKAKIKCVDSEGEAAIFGDLPSAKTEAIARAKWNAIEQVAGVVIKAQSFVQNFSLIDDAVIKEIKGVITGYKLKREWKDKDIYKVIINACVDENKAGEALSSLSINNSIAVFLPVRKPKVISESEETYSTPYSKSQYYHLSKADDYEESNILSETLIGKLTEMGAKVVDVAPAHIADAQMIENVMRSGNYLSLRSIMYKSLSNLLLIGKVDYTRPGKKGQDVGYGISMPFHSVITRLTYRIVAKEATSNRIIILDAGIAEGRGMASDLEEAWAQSLKDLAEKFSSLAYDKIKKYLQGVTRKITVKVNNVNNINKNIEIKDTIQKITWVLAVEEKGLGEFLVSYPENPLYLANSLSQKGFKIVNYSPDRIIIQE